ncbi:MAG: ACP S-malonyltransferase [Saprospiraceae bacterium]|nr:ACP S-malonyltransferase [Saprospiraceae bacterium]
MKAYLFPGQGAQFAGMGNDLYESSEQARSLFAQANDILGFDIAEVMFNGTEEELKQTKVTQPAIFLHSVIKSKMAGDAFQPAGVAGHSLGEFSALVAADVLDFEGGLKLVYQRALAMQKACEAQESTMAAVLGLDDHIVEEICAQVDEVVVPANYNCPGQIVISGSVEGVSKASEKLLEAGARKTVMLKVGGAFHSPLMEPARAELAAAIEATPFRVPKCPIYQNVSAKGETDPEIIKTQLVAQLTAPVRWTQTMKQLIEDGFSSFYEVGGNGKVLRGLLLKIDRKLPIEAI